MVWNTYSIESHLSQFHETNSLQIIHEDVGVKYPPHPLQECLLYIPSLWVTCCINAAKGGVMFLTALAAQRDYGKKWIRFVILNIIFTHPWGL
jgi:hypothetical protein